MWKVEIKKKCGAAPTLLKETQEKLDPLSIIRKTFCLNAFVERPWKMKIWFRRGDSMRKGMRLSRAPRLGRLLLCYVAACITRQIRDHLEDDDDDGWTMMMTQGEARRSEASALFSLDVGPVYLRRSRNNLRFGLSCFAPRRACAWTRVSDLLSAPPPRRNLPTFDCRCAHC